MQSWIERRIGGEIETRQHPNGQLALGLPRGRRARANRGAGRAGRNGGADEAPQVPAPDGGDASLGERREAFFEQLPPDGFTQEEEQLREALMGFIGDWQAPEPPTLSTAGSDPRVRDARAAFLPKGCGASLKEWIDRRIGGEIETTVPESKGMEVALGFRGQLDHAAAARALRKRKADSGKGGPGGAGGGGKAGKGRRTGP
uniref:Uncharacterized protein n=1 Tax=Alexandrium andersonii TaxID=327968 RepID=A0A7S2FAX7_9DINO